MMSGIFRLFFPEKSWYVVVWMKKMIEKSESFSYSQRSSLLVNVEGRIKHSRTNCRWHFFRVPKGFHFIVSSVRVAYRLDDIMGMKRPKWRIKSFNSTKSWARYAATSVRAAAKEMVRGKYVKRVDFPQFSEYKYANCLMMMALWQQIEIVDNFKAFKARQAELHTFHVTVVSSRKSPLCERIWKSLKFFMPTNKLSLWANYRDKNSFVERGNISRKVLERQ